jgi:hypothetical protein
MKNPTQQELMEYVDGTLVPQRFREIEILVSQSGHLQHEISLLKAMRRSVQQNMMVSPSKRFTANVMNELLPIKKETFWFQLAKNSSNLFAMILVLSMIGIVLSSGSGGTKNGSNFFTKGVESYSSAYNSVVESVSGWKKQYSQPVGELTKSPSGKFILIGLTAFFLFTIVDELIGKKFFHARIKH